MGAMIVSGAVGFDEAIAGYHADCQRKHGNILILPFMSIDKGKLIFAQSSMTGLSNTLSRISIAALYLCLVPKGIVRYISWLMLFYFVAFVLAQIITEPFECRPILFLWNPENLGVKCINIFLYFELSGILNSVEDVALMAIPAPTTWKLQTPLSRKAGIAIVFLSGSFSVPNAFVAS